MFFVYAIFPIRRARLFIIDNMKTIEDIINSTLSECGIAIPDGPKSVLVARLSDFIIDACVEGRSLGWRNSPEQEKVIRLAHEYAIEHNMEIQQEGAGRCVTRTSIPALHCSWQTDSSD